MFKDNGEVIHFANPKVQASLGSNTYAISGQAETKCSLKIFLRNQFDRFLCLFLKRYKKCYQQLCLKWV